MLRRSCLLSLALLAHYLGTVASVSAHNPANHISRVSLLFACHLDVGFHSGGTEPGYDNVVISRYFNQYFPAAAQLGQQLRNRPGGTERLAFLTHSWLVSLFLNCPARIGITCPNATTVDQFRAAVHHGDIVWHALPHNAQVELYDDSLLRFGVRMTHDVDRAFGLPPKVTMSQRDVPGLTRAAVPILVDEGVKAISVGVNGGSAPPGVPKNTPFIWRDPPSGKQLLAMWHPGGYSGFPVDDRDECVQVKGFHHALCFAWSGDNTGPPSLEDVLAIFSKVRKNFPKARVEAAGFDGFVSELEAAAPKLHLPVVTAEIGDTWIHGATADPAKLSEYRALLRMRRASRERYGDEAFNRFSRLLLKLPEHTGGVDSKEYPGEWESWNNADLQKRLADKRLDNPFVVAVSSWVRQRAYSLWAVQELGSSEAGLAAWQALAALQDGKAAPTPDAVNSSFKRCDMQRPLVFESDSWQLEVSNMTGAIVGLRFKAGSASDSSSGGSSRSRGGLQRSSYGSSGSRPSLWTRIVGTLGWPGGSLSVSSGSGVGKSWAGFDAPLALPVYSTYAEDDYDAIWDSYSYFPRDRLADWFYKDFGKPNSTVKGGARRAEYLPQAQRVWWRRTTGGGLHVTIKATFDSYAVQFAGAPKALWTEIRAPAGSPDLQLDVTWEDKTPTRLPEAFWLRWAPRSDAVNASSWLMYKLGQPISPLEMMLNGSHALHAVGDEGVSVDSADGSQRLYIRSLDAAVVSPGRHTPFPVLSAAPDLRYGMSYLAAANIWGTNYAQWFPYAAGDATMRFRFVLQVKGKSSTASVEAA